jgi:DNA-binding response OmpR family regulator
MFRDIPSRPCRRRYSHFVQRVLVVDDDPVVAEVVTRYLERDGLRVEVCSDGPSALAAAARETPDLVVLDLMLPGIDGMEVCRRLRAPGPVPVVMLTALGEEEERVLGLQLGADDYVTKPFSPRELSLRVRSVLRRTAGVVALPAGAGPPGLPGPAGAPRALTSSDQPPDVLIAGDLVVDVDAHEVRRGGEPVPLTAREFELLVCLLRSPRRAFGRAELMRKVWGWSYGDQSTVTVHIRRLREKIEIDPSAPRLLVTVWGVGYRYEPPGRGPV